MATLPMNRPLLLGASFALLLLFGGTDSAYAYIERDSSGDKYTYSKRRIQQFDEFTTGSGITTFDRRAEYLRATQLRRIQEDLDARVFGDTRSRPFYLWPEGQERFENTIQRRLNEAEQQGGVRLRSEMRGLTRQTRKTMEERDEEVRAYRDKVRSAEINKYNPQYNSIQQCYTMARRRQAQCLYEQRVDLED